RRKRRREVRTMTTKTLNLTFVIGHDAAAAVGRQLDRNNAYWSRVGGPAREVSTTMLSEHLSRLLIESYDLFDVRLPESKLRLVWSAAGSGSGLLHVVCNQTLMTINLLLGGFDPRADEQAIESLVDLLGPIDSFAECLDMVRDSRRPLIATFWGADPT